MILSSDIYMRALAIFVPNADDRRVGGLESKMFSLLMMPVVYYRIGGLECLQIPLRHDGFVYRRIGGLAFLYIKEAAIIQPLFMYP